MEADIKILARNIIQGNEKRKKRIKKSKASAFDMKAAAVVENALRASCENIPSSIVRKQMQDKVYESIVYNVPYEHMADVVCGRRQFYDYRNDFILLVAKEMGMLPDGIEKR